MTSDVITINASSTLVQGVGAHVNIIADGQVIGSAMIGESPASYSFNTSLAPNTDHDIQVVYDNDTVINGQDRNLLLNSISVNGQTIAANSGSEVYHAQGQGDFASDGAMNWNGTAEFSVPASQSSSANPTTPAPSQPIQASQPSVTGPGFHVSTSGNDNGDGSADRPFATLERAVSAMEGSGTHTTYIDGGTYSLNSTLNLSQGDSGFTFASTPGSGAVLDGGGSLTTLIQLNGASGVTLQGLTFQNTGGGRAAVVLDGASGNHIVGNLFANTGEGLLLNNGSSNNIVSGNELDNSATSAVEIQDGSNNNSFDSNLVNGTGAIGTQGGGFFLHGVNGNAIAHNLVENTSGIGIGIENYDSNTINVGNSITGNTLQNTSADSRSTDSGAIYELGRSQVDTQSVISGNYISGPTQPASSDAHIVGIYLDDLTSGVQVTNNIVADTVTHAVQIHGGSNIAVHNNIFDLGANSGLEYGKDSAVLFQGDGGPSDNVSVTQNIVTSTSPSPLSYGSIGGGGPTIDNNFYSDLFNSHFQTNGDGLSESNAQYGNAQFANPAAGNYTLADNSGANSIGFTPIDQSSIGLQPVTAHWYAA